MWNNFAACPDWTASWFWLVFFAVSIAAVGSLVAMLRSILRGVADDIRRDQKATSERTIAEYERGWAACERMMNGPTAKPTPAPVVDAPPEPEPLPALNPCVHCGGEPCWTLGGFLRCSKCECTTMNPILPTREAEAAAWNAANPLPAPELTTAELAATFAPETPGTLWGIAQIGGKIAICHSEILPGIFNMRRIAGEDCADHLWYVDGDFRFPSWSAMYAYMVENGYSQDQLRLATSVKPDGEDIPQPVKPAQGCVDVDKERPCWKVNHETGDIIRCLPGTTNKTMSDGWEGDFHKFFHNRADAREYSRKIKRERGEV